jgi:hypothetical protein
MSPVTHRSKLFQGPVLPIWQPQLPERASPAALHNWIFMLDHDHDDDDDEDHYHYHYHIIIIDYHHYHH